MCMACCRCPTLGLTRYDDKAATSKLMSILPSSTIQVLSDSGGLWWPALAVSGGCGGLPGQRLRLASWPHPVLHLRLEHRLAPGLL